MPCRSQRYWGRRCVANDRYAHITSEFACKAAASADGITYQTDTDSDGYPKGCLYCPNTCESGYYFNAHSSGGTKSGMSPVCTKGA